MKITCVRMLEIDAGHRLQKHESKCKNAHGHRYKFEIYCEADQLDKVGRVIDFGKVKEVIGTWLDEKWDHAFIAESGDPIIEGYLRKFDQKHFVTAFPPTAENLSKFLLEKAGDLLREYGITVTKVICWETPNCRAEAVK